MEALQAGVDTMKYTNKKGEDVTDLVLLFRALCKLEEMADNGEITHDQSFSARLRLLENVRKED